MTKNLTKKTVLTHKKAFASVAAYGFFILLSAILALASQPAQAKLATVEAKTIVDSEEPLDRRIYAYDMGVDSSDNVHIVYTKPVVNQDYAQVIYERRINGQWQTPIVLSAQAWIYTRSTHLIVDANDTVHISYIGKTATDQYLAYRKVVNGVVGAEQNISPGGWHSTMQIDDNGRAMFIREGQAYPDTTYQFKLFVTTDNTSWTEIATDLTNVKQFTIASFIYSNGKYHLTYGDGAYTKPVLDGKGSSDYVDGKFHNFYYASSTDGVHWTPHLIDNSGTLYELEFWTSMTLDNGLPVVAFYKYAEYGGSYNTGSSVLMARQKSAGKWKKRIIAGENFPAGDAGMGVFMVTNGPNDIIAAWNDSPVNLPFNFIEDDMTGGVALYRSGSDDAWSYKGLLDKFSAEGTPVLAIRNNHLYSLVLGDWQDTKLYFREYNIAALPKLKAVPQLESPANGSMMSGTFLMDWSTIAGTDRYYMVLFKNGTKDTEVWRSPDTASEHWIGTPLADGNYEWWVQRFVNGEGSWSRSSCFQVGGTTAPPQAPGTLLASKGQYNGVALSWSKVSAADSYDVYRHTGPLPMYATRIAQGVTDTWYSDTSAEDGMVYYYSIKSVKNGISGNFSASKEGFSDTTQNSPPAGPMLLSNPGVFLLIL